jgi:hypothetical protein
MGLSIIALPFLGGVALNTAGGILLPLGQFLGHKPISEHSGEDVGRDRRGSGVPRGSGDRGVPGTGYSGDADRKNLQQDQPTDDDPASNAPTPENGD